MIDSPYPLCIVSSYGGSGSTFLIDKIKELCPTFKFFHNHAPPINGILGAPLFNPVTGGAEGPYSQWLELPRGSKIIIIYRKPSEAYLSRVCYEHFSHIWYGSPNYKKVLGSEFLGLSHDQRNQLFTQKKIEHESKSLDILGLEDYFQNWKSYAKKKQVDIAFVKYESLNTSWNQLLHFLNSQDKVTMNDLSDFDAKTREVPDKIRAIFHNFEYQLKDDPNYMESLAGQTVNKPLEKIAIDAVFTVENLGAGFGDSFSRINEAYNFIKYFTSMKFIRPEYSNYHCKELDFIDLFNIKGDLPRSDVNHYKVNHIRFSDFVFQVLYDRNFLQSQTLYSITIDLYPHDFKSKFYKLLFDIPNTLLETVSLKESFEYSPNFSQTDHIYKVVFHLRRSDIIKDKLINIVDPKLLSGIHSRKLLTIKEACHVLSEYLSERNIKKKVEIIVISDGVDDLMSKFTENPAALNVLNDINQELHEEVLEKNNMKIIQRIIGKGSINTLKSIYAIYHSNLTLSASSSFPNLICYLAGNELKHVP